MSSETFCDDRAIGDIIDEAENALSCFAILIAVIRDHSDRRHIGNAIQRDAVFCDIGGVLGRVECDAHGLYIQSAGGAHRPDRIYKIRLSCDAHIVRRTLADR
jgi:hypothetical protein